MFFLFLQFDAFLLDAYTACYVPHIRFAQLHSMLMVGQREANVLLPVLNLKVLAEHTKRHSDPHVFSADSEILSFQHAESESSG